MTSNTTQKILERLPDFWEKGQDSNTYALVESFAQEFDSYSVQVDNLHLEVFVDTSTGTRLDDLGKIFKLSRKSGETDDSFRLRIKAYWPGYSGGGTTPSLKTTVSRMTGVPESEITITETAIPNTKFIVTIPIIDAERLALKPTIEQIIFDIKAAGVWPFFVWELSGDLLSEDFSVTDIVTIYNPSIDAAFLYELSLCEGEKLLW